MNFEELQKFARKYPYLFKGYSHYKTKDSLKNFIEERLKHKNVIPGGVGDHLTWREVDLKELDKGIKIEEEHSPIAKNTKDPSATDFPEDISYDHLEEVGNYNTLLDASEKIWEEDWEDALKGFNLTGIVESPEQTLLFYKKKPEKAKKTLFHEPEYDKYSKIISLKTPEQAKKSTKILEQEYNNAKTLDKKLRVARVSVESANRSYEMAKNPKYSPETKKEKKEVGDIYRESSNELLKKYAKDKQQNLGLNKPRHKY